MLSDVCDMQRHADASPPVITTRIPRTGTPMARKAGRGFYWLRVIYMHYATALTRCHHPRRGWRVRWRRAATHHNIGWFMAEFYGWHLVHVWAHSNGETCARRSLHTCVCSGVQKPGSMCGWAPCEQINDGVKCQFKEAQLNYFTSRPRQHVSTFWWRAVHAGCWWFVVAVACADGMRACWILHAMCVCVVKTGYYLHKFPIVNVENAETAGGHLMFDSILKATRHTQDSEWSRWYIRLQRTLNTHRCTVIASPCTRSVTSVDARFNYCVLYNMYALTFPFRA